MWFLLYQLKIVIKKLSPGNNLLSGLLLKAISSIYLSLFPMQIYSISLLLNLLISYWFLPSKIIGDFNKAFSLSKSGRLNSFHSVNNNNASAFDEADQASRFAELFGEVVTSSTKKLET